MCTKICIFRYCINEVNGIISTVQDRSSLSSKASMDTLRLHLHSIVPPRPFFRLFTRPFRRKSVPSSPALPPKTYRSSSEGPSEMVTLPMSLRRRRLLRKRLKKRIDLYVDCRETKAKSKVVKDSVTLPVVSSELTNCT